MARNKHEKVVRAFRVSRGIAREVHFEAGGTPATWLGVHTVCKDRRKEADRRACRGRSVPDHRHR